MSEPLICPLCGADMKEYAFFGYVSRCSEHDAYLCPACCTCTSLEPTPELLDRCKQMRTLCDLYIQPILKGHRHHGTVN